MTDQGALGDMARPGPGRDGGLAAGAGPARQGDRAGASLNAPVPEVLDLLPQPALLVAPDSAILYANPALGRVIGHDPGRLRGCRAPYPWWPPAERDRAARELGRVLAEGSGVFGDPRYAAGPARVSVAPLGSGPEAGRLLLWQGGPEPAWEELDRTRRELAELRERYGQAVRAGRSGLWELIPDETRIKVDDSLLSLLGLDRRSSGEGIDRWLHRIPSPDRHRVLEAFDELISGRSRRVTLQHRLVAADQRITWWLSTGQRVEPQGGGRLRILGHSTEITRFHDAEMKLSRLHRGLEAISLCHQALVRAKREPELLEEVCRLVAGTGGYDFAWIGVAQHDPARGVDPVCQAGSHPGLLEGAEITWGPEGSGPDPTGRALASGRIQITHDLSRDGGGEPWRCKLRQAGFQSAVSLPLKDAGRVFAALTVYSSRPGAFDELELAWLQNLTEDLSHGITYLRAGRRRRLAEEELKASSEALDAILLASPVGLALVDRNERLLWTNPALQRMLGYRPSQLLHLPAVRLFPEADTYHRARQELTRSGLDQGLGQWDSRLLTASGQTLEVSLRTRQIDQADPSKGYIAAVLDISARKRSEQSLRRLTEDLARRVRHLDCLYRISDLEQEPGASLETLLDTTVELIRTGWSHPDQVSLRLELEGLVRSDPDPPGDAPLLERAIEAYGRPAGMVRVAWLGRAESPAESGAAEVFPPEDADWLEALAGRLGRIAERRRAEMSLRDSELRLRQAERVGRMGNWEYDLAQGRMTWSEQAYRLYQRDPAQGPPGSPQDLAGLYHPGSAPLFSQALAQAMKGDDPVEVDLPAVLPSGDRVFHGVVITPQRDADGGLIRLVGTVQDITERKRMERQLLHSREQLRLALTATSEALWDYNLSDGTLYWSSNGMGMLGWEPGEAHPTYDDWLEMVHPEDRENLAEAIAAHVRGETAQIRVEYRQRNKAGDWLWLLCRGRAVEFGAQGAPTRLVGTFSDVTERVLLNRRLLQSQKMEALGALSGGIAHDFNNILYAIMGYTQMGLGDLENSRYDRLGFCLSQVLSAGKRARDLIGQILAFSRRSEGRQTAVEMSPLVAEVLKLLRASLPSTITIEQDLGAAGSRVMADPGKIHQILMNLAANAGYAMRQGGGVLKVSLRQLRLSGTSLRAYPSLKPGQYLQLRVSDSGVGMDSETLDKVFEPFFTTKPRGEGTGLGLSVVHGIVSSLGGAVSVKSTPGRGTVFDVLLPVAPGSEAKPDPALSEYRGRGERVMVVDDEEAVLRMMIMMLLDLGYRPEGFSDPRVAWQRFQESPADWDLAILDQTMPGLTGLELVEKMTDLAPGFSIILVTGYSDTVDGDLARQAGVRDFRHKPLLRQELGEIMARCLGAADEPPGVGG